MDKSENDFAHAIALVERSCRDYWGGFRPAYRTVATQLRILLCDKDALLPRVRPEVRLPRLRMSEDRETDPHFASVALQIPGRLTILGDGGLPHFKLHEARNPVLMSIEEWLDQPMLNPRITIRSVIKSVADKEGAHSDRRDNLELAFLKAIGFGETSSHEQTVVAIGDLVLTNLQQVGG